MQTTANYGFKKYEPTIDNVDVTAMNDNMDIADVQLKKHANGIVYETAGGTATAITLTNVTLENGHPKTFIASANNNGSATTINSKHLYKPNTTTAPTLIAGKAYTAWYNLSGDCFFIKASAEGTATVDKVLAGETFSNNNDTGLTGTMINNTNAGIVITPGTVDQAVPQGYTPGTTASIKILGDSDFIASNLKKDVVCFGITGTCEPLPTPTTVGDSMIASSDTEVITTTTTNLSKTTMKQVTVDKAGDYRVKWSHMNSSGSQMNYLQMFIDGVAYGSIYTPPTSYTAVAVDLTNLAVGTTIELKTWNNYNLAQNTKVKEFRICVASPYNGYITVNA